MVTLEQDAVPLYHSMADMENMLADCFEATCRLNDWEKEMQRTWSALQGVGCDAQAEDDQNASDRFEQLLNALDQQEQQYWKAHATLMAKWKKAQREVAAYEGAMGRV